MYYLLNPPLMFHWMQVSRPYLTLKKGGIVQSYHVSITQPAEYVKSKVGIGI